MNNMQSAQSTDGHALLHDRIWNNAIEAAVNEIMRNTTIFHEDPLVCMCIDAIRSLKQ